MQRIAYRALAIALGLVFIILSLELFSFIYLKIENLSTSESYAIHYNREASGSQYFDPHPTAPYKRQRIAHPYFGSVYTSGNNYGFNDPKQFPYRKKENEFVIGIFGGSTASHFGEYLQKSRKWENAIANQDKKIVIVNLALGGMKQPQMFYVATRFLEFVDAALILDGWNEAQAAMCPYPAEYPEGYAVLYNSRANSDAFMRISALELDWRKYNNRLYNSVFSKSSTVFLLWNRQKSDFIYESIRLRKELESAVGRPQEVFENCPSDSESKIKLKYDVWKKYYRYFQLLAREIKVPTLQFLQPNPYLPGVKPLSEAEKSIVNFAALRSGLPDSQGEKALKFRLNYLHDNLPGTHDLTEIFKNVDQTVYIDPYTHLNELGYDILQKHMLQQLRRAKVF